MTLSKGTIREITDLRYFPLTALAICLPGGFILFAPESWVDPVLLDNPRVRKFHKSPSEMWCQRYRVGELIKFHALFTAHKRGRH
jgi:hypothetical protein